MRPPPAGACRPATAWRWRSSSPAGPATGAWPGSYMNCKNRIGSHGGYNPPERGLGLLTGGYAEYMHLHPNSIVHPMRSDIPAEIAVMYNPLGAGVRWALEYGGVHLGIERARARRRPARPRRHPRLPVRRRGHDHRHRPDPRREEA